MPRLTNTTYLEQRKQLQHPEVERHISRLTPADQWALFDFYKYHLDLTDKEALRHRKNVTERHPSLPHRAGRAFHRLLRGEHQPVVTTRLPATPKSGRSRGSITVRSIVKPEVDIDRIARALTAHIQEMTQELQRMYDRMESEKKD